MATQICGHCGRPSTARGVVCPHCANAYGPLAAVASRSPAFGISAPGPTGWFASADRIVRKWGAPVLGSLLAVACLVALPDWSGERAAERARIEQEAAAKAQAQAKAQAKARLAADVQRGVEMFKRFEDAVGRGEVLVGMTADQAIRAWPWPRHMTNTVTAQGKSEMWIYGVRGERTLFIENGVVRAIHRSN